jgi:ubiquitin-activating enzyme E1
VASAENPAPPEPTLTDDEVVEFWNKKLVPLQKDLSSKKFSVSVIHFEKDDSKNFHMDFIAAAANLRARNYSINEVDRMKAKVIAGRIIPAIANTTACVVGLDCIEFVKAVQKKKSISAYRDANVNLAFPVLNLMEPSKSKKKHATAKENKVVVEDVPLEQLIHMFKKQYHLEDVDLIQPRESQRFIWGKNSTKDKLKKKLSELTHGVGVDLSNRKSFVLSVNGEKHGGGDYADYYVVVKMDHK